VATAVLVAAIPVTGGVIVMLGGKQQALAAQPAAVHTAQVEMRTLSARVSEAGILTYSARPDGSPYSVINQTRGTYTELPQVGQVIGRGRVVYRVSNAPVVLMYGSTPAYRTLSAGASGPDVAELNANLVALRYARASELSPTSASFDWATIVALEKLQASLGVPETGTLQLGQAAFEPSALRVTSLAAPLGGNAQAGGTVMQATSTTRQVQVALDASHQTSLAVGDKVSITLPNNQTTPGVVSSVGTVATCPVSSSSGGPGSGSAAPGTDACSSTNAGTSTPTITVGITPSHPAATGKWDRAPVRVGITTARARNALTVPVTALLARSDGVYAVEVAGAGPGATNHLVAVSLGLFDDAEGLVQVAGAGLAAGQEVVVPST
jgi:hypothetical protein